MKHALTHFAIFLCLLTSSAATAKSLAEPTPPSLAGYADGFFLRSADDAFRLQILSLLQGQYVYQDIRQTGALDTGSFRLLRARMQLIGTLWTSYDFSLLASHSTGDAAPENTFWQADMTARIVPAFNITAGTITLPMDRQGEGSPDTLALIEEPITATQEDGVQNRTIGRQAFGNPTTLGLRLWGDVGRFHYIVGFANGDDFRIVNQTNQWATGVRLWVDILDAPDYSESDAAYSATPQLAWGVGGTFDDQDAIDANINRVTVDSSFTGSSDVIFKWRGFAFLTEAYYRHLRVATGNFNLTDFGYYAQAGYFVLPKTVEVVGRAAQIYREGPDNNAFEFGAGVNWYIRDNHVKWQFDAARLLDYDANAGTGGVAAYRYRTMLTLQI